MSQLHPKGRASRLAGGARRLAPDLSPLRSSRDFRLLWTGQVISMAGRQVTVVALPFQVYTLTRSTLAVGAIGVVQLVPHLVVSLVGGSIADAVDRRRLLLLTQVVLGVLSLLLTLGAMAGSPPLWTLYLLAAAIAAVGAIDNPARTATAPNTVPRRLLGAAIALIFAQYQVALIAGPVLGGVIIAALGVAPAYAIDAATFVVAFVTVWMISPQPVAGGPREPMPAAIAQGLRFAWQHKPILGGFATDLCAMGLAMPRAVFPAMALGTFHTGPGALGFLYAAPGVGAIVGASVSGPMARIERPGRAVLIAAAGWGASITAFSLCGFSLPLALLFLVVAGAADAFSAICRNLVVQTEVPDALRGRISAAHSMVVVGGPQLGDFRAGGMAAAIGPEASVFVGGVLCVIGCGALTAVFPDLARYRRPAALSADPGRGEAAATDPG